MRPMPDLNTPWSQSENRRFVMIFDYVGAISRLADKQTGRGCPRAVEEYRPIITILRYSLTELIGIPLRSRWLQTKPPYDPRKTACFKGASKADVCNVRAFHIPRSKRNRHYTQPVYLTSRDWVEETRQNSRQILTIIVKSSYNTRWA